MAVGGVKSLVLWILEVIHNCPENSNIRVQLGSDSEFQLWESSEKLESVIGWVDSWESSAAI